MNELEIIADEDRRKHLDAFLMELAKSENIFEDNKAKHELYISLESIYHINGKTNEENFRHLYSRLFPLITQIKDDTTQGSVDILIENLYSLMIGYRPQNLDPITNEKIDIGISIRKLFDHVNLDVARLLYTTQDQSKSLSDFLNLQKQVAETKKIMNL